MKNIQPGMNVPKQRRKIEHLHDNGPEHHRFYLAWLLDEFDRAVAEGLPQPASEFLARYYEEFDID